jgi:hypothetical protein
MNQIILIVPSKNSPAFNSRLGDSFTGGTDDPKNAFYLKGLGQFSSCLTLVNRPDPSVLHQAPVETNTIQMHGKCRLLLAGMSSHVCRG